MKNVEVNGLWISDSNELPIITLMCIKSYIKHNHKFILWSYNQKFSNLPVGCILKDANEILESKYLYKDIICSYGHFSDWWRWKFLYENGGFWSDLDVCCLKDDIPEKNGFHLCSMSNSIHDTMVGTLMLPKRHSVAKTMLEICKKPYQLTEFDFGELRKLKEEALAKWHTHEDLLKNAPYPCTYRMFGQVLSKYGITKELLLQRETIYPVRYEEIQHLNLPAWTLDKVVLPCTCAIHLWGSYYSKSINLFVQIQCILRELYLKYYK